MLCAMSCTFLKQLLICVLVGMIHVSVCTDTYEDDTECPSQSGQTDISFLDCTIRNFSLHLPINSGVVTLNFYAVNILDKKGCTKWMSQLPVISDFEIQSGLIEDKIEGLADCLSGFNTPIKYADLVDQIILLSSTELADENWLNKHGYKIFGGLTNKTVERVALNGLSLTTANMQKYLQGVRITNALDLKDNIIEKIETSDFSTLELANLEFLDFEENKICFINLAAFRNLTSLTHIVLDDNPCYVPSDTLLSWKNTFPDAIVYAKTESCAKFKPNCSNVLKDDEYTFTSNEGIISNVGLMDCQPSCSLLNPLPTQIGPTYNTIPKPCKEPLPRLPLLVDKADSDQSQDFMALIAVLSCFAALSFVTAVAFISWRRLKVASSKRSNPVLKDAVQVNGVSQYVKLTNDDKIGDTNVVISAPLSTIIVKQRLGSSYMVNGNATTANYEPNDHASPEATD